MNLFLVCANYLFFVSHVLLLHILYLYFLPHVSKVYPLNFYPFVGEASVYGLLIFPQLMTIRFSFSSLVDFNYWS